MWLRWPLRAWSRTAGDARVWSRTADDARKYPRTWRSVRRWLPHSRKAVGELRKRTMNEVGNLCETLLNCSQDVGHTNVRAQSPNDPKLRCGGPGAPGKSRAARGEGAAPAGLGGGAGAVTEPGEPGAEHRRLTAMPAVTCSAWLGVDRSIRIGSERNALIESGARCAAPKERAVSEASDIQTFGNSSPCREAKAWRTAFRSRPRKTSAETGRERPAPKP